MPAFARTPAGRTYRPAAVVTIDDLILDAAGATGVIVVEPGTALVTTAPPIVLPEARRAARPPGGPAVRSRTVAAGGAIYIAASADAAGGAWHGTALRAAVDAELARSRRRLADAGVACHRLPTHALASLAPAVLQRLAAAARRPIGDPQARFIDVAIGQDREGNVMAVRIPPWRAAEIVVAIAGGDAMAQPAAELLAAILASRAARAGATHGRLRLCVLDPRSPSGIAGLMAADIVLATRQAEPAAAALGAALGLSDTAASWLGQIDDTVAAVVADGMVRWARVWQ